MNTKSEIFWMAYCAALSGAALTFDSRQPRWDAIENEANKMAEDMLDRFADRFPGVFERMED